MCKRFVVLFGVLLALAVALPVFAGGGQEEESAATSEPAAAEAEPYEIAFLLKSQAQDFWNHIRIGGMNYAKENSDKVNATVYAAKNDAAVEEALGILENIIVHSLTLSLWPRLILRQWHLSLIRPLLRELLL